MKAYSPRSGKHKLEGVHSMSRPKLFSTFLFSEPYEKEILHAKLCIESTGIEHWVIVENSFTFQGEHKGNHLDRIFAEDSRFDQFQNKVTVVSAEIEFPKIDYTRNVHLQGWSAEEKQRELARGPLEKICSANDWIMVTDTDEILDCSNESRMTLLHTKIKNCKGEWLRLPRRRFNYDFDNLWSEHRSTPLVKAGHCLTSVGSIGGYRSLTIGVRSRWRKPMVFEYSFCFPKNEIIRKYDTFTHPGLDQKEITQAIECNRTAVFKESRSKLSCSRKFWFEKVALTEKNSPAFIRENFQRLKTNTVPDDYKENRIKHHADLFSPTAKVAYFLSKLRPSHLVSVMRLTLKSYR